MKRAGLAALLAIGCTTFDGLTVPPASEAGVDASPDAPDAAPSYPGYLSLADAARFCANVFKCHNLAGSVLSSISVPVDANNYSSCVSWMAGPLPPDHVGITDASKMLSCAANATSCQKAGECLPEELIDGNDPRCTGVDGGANRVCAESGSAVYDCSTDFILHCSSAFYPAGSSCLAGSDGLHWCAQSTTCSATTHCNGPYLEYCSVGNMLMGFSCVGDGMTCALDTSSSAYDCLSNGVVKACSVIGVTCSGSSVSACTLTEGGRESIFNCAAMGGACDATGLPYCKSAQATCTPFDPSVNTCSGSSISLCVGGQPAMMDCSAIGSTCVPAANGQTAHCQ